MHLVEADPLLQGLSTSRGNYQRFNDSEAERLPGRLNTCTSSHSPSVIASTTLHTSASTPKTRELSNVYTYLQRTPGIAQASPLLFRQNILDVLDAHPIAAPPASTVGDVGGGTT